MRKPSKCQIMGLLCIFFEVCMAQPISESRAMNVGMRFFYGLHPGKTQPATRSMTEAMATVWEYEDINCMYAVNMPDSGWVLVAGDERSTPILAVSENGTFPDKDDMPPAMLWLLEDYARQIKFIQDSCQNAGVNMRWNAIERGSFLNATPLSTTYHAPLLQRPNRGEVNWNQSFNNDNSCGTRIYNKFCPDWYALSCGRTYVGCTAVAMAQIMWYWQWPHTGLIHSGIDMSGNPVGTQELHLYNWNLMPAELKNNTPLEQADMIAMFLRDCGYAAKMKYAIDGSGASLENAKNALINTFAYSDEMVYKQKNFFSWNWKNRIKNSIDDGCPVLYAGYGSGGHAFVVDGYDDDRFHINWGWGGDSNGYFELGNLTPPGHNYNSDHEAIFDIRPNVVCGPLDINGSSIYRVGQSGAVTVSNVTVPSGTTAVYYSGTSVTLRPGFKATAGSRVHIAIQNFPCNGIAPASLDPIGLKSVYAEPETGGSTGLNLDYVQGTSIYPNPTDGALYVQTSREVARIELYGLSGEKLLESRETTLDLHGLQEGMYVLMVHFADGTVHSEKVIRNQ